MFMFPREMFGADFIRQLKIHLAAASLQGERAKT